MWNYRVIRRKHVRVVAGVEQVDYTYGIHEAYYDKNNKVVAITVDPIDPYGENVTELRASWVMMGEAFGQPILDYDGIPEPGHDEENLLVKGIDKSDIVEEEETEELSKEIFKDYDPLEYQKELEDERIKAEKVHNEKFVGIETLKSLIDEVVSDYNKNKDKE